MAIMSSSTGEIGPDHRSGHVEEKRRHAVGGDLGDLPEHDPEDDGGEQRLNEMPDRAEYSLLVLCNEVTVHEEEHQVAVLPELAELEVEQPAGRFDDGGPAVVVWCGRSGGFVSAGGSDGRCGNYNRFACFG
jgi:hypothetical protein